MRRCDLYATATTISKCWTGASAREKGALRYDFVGVPGCLPEGWERRVQPLWRGNALDLQTLGRQDLLCTKLVALMDREEDLQDCIAMAPTPEELAAAWPFVQQYEGNQEVREVYWIPKARAAYAEIRKALGHARA